MDDLGHFGVGMGVALEFIEPIVGGEDAAFELVVGADADEDDRAVCILHRDGAVVSVLVVLRCHGPAGGEHLVLSLEFDVVVLHCASEGDGVSLRLDGSVLAPVVPGLHVVVTEVGDGRAQGKREFARL